MILLDVDEINDLDNALVDIPEWINETDEYKSFLFSTMYFTKAQANKILIELQTIYNLPDGGMFHNKMGEFIKSLMEEVG